MPRSLALILVSAMLALAILIELAFHGVCLWQTKVPLVALLAWSAASGWRQKRGGPG